VLFAYVRAAPEGDEGQLLAPPLGAGGERLAQRREDRVTAKVSESDLPQLA